MGTLKGFCTGSGGGVVGASDNAAGAGAGVDGMGAGGTGGGGELGLTVGLAGVGVTPGAT